MTVLDRLTLDDFQIETRIKTWLSHDQWTNTTQIYSLVGHQNKRMCQQVREGLKKLLMSGEIVARDIHNTGGRPRTEFRLSSNVKLRGSPLLGCPARTQG